MTANTADRASSPRSPRFRARVTGAVYLLYFLAAFFAVWLAGRGNSAASLAANLISDALYICVTVLFYYLFKPVGASLSMLAAVFSLAGCTITVLNLFHLAARISPLLFFGPYCLLIGYLILQSAFLPRFLGALMVLAGLGWLGFLLLPPASRLVPFLEDLGVLAEGLLMLWLLLFGVNPHRWNDQAARAGSRRA